MVIVPFLLATFAITACPSQNRTVCDLIEQLHDPAKASVLSEQLKNMITDAPNAADDVTIELNHRLADFSDLPMWRTEARLAGNLKLIGTAEVLAASLNTDTRGGNHDITGMSRTVGLKDDQAGQALVQLGGAAIPFVKHELADGNRLGRFRAAYVLIKMNSPEAEAVLKEQYPVEADPGLKNLIGRHIGALP